MSDPAAPAAGSAPRPTIGVSWLELPLIPYNAGVHRLRTFGHLLRHVVAPAQRTLLDLGAGHCRFSEVGTQCGYEVTAVDARTERLPLALGTIRFIQSDVRAFDPAGYGVIAIIGLLYHLQLDEQITLLRRCAYGAAVVVETQVHMAERIAADKRAPWHEVVESGGYCGVEYPEKNTPMASVGNPTSFWHTETSLLRLFAETGYARVQLIEPVFSSDYGARRFYVLDAA